MKRFIEDPIAIDAGRDGKRTAFQPGTAWHPLSHGSSATPLGFCGTRTPLEPTGRTYLMREEWHLFKIRRALLTDKNICFAVDGVPNFVVRLPDLQRATASMLYVNAVVLLNDGIETRLEPSELASKRTLDKRLKALRDRGDLQNYGALDLVRVRRNEIGHEIKKDVTLDELDYACSAIQSQLAAWGLVLDEPPYTLQWERSSARASSNPDAAFEQDRILRIMRGDSWVFESKTEVVVWRLGKGPAASPQPIS